MTASARKESGWRGSPWRWVVWGVPAGLLMLPAIAMRFTPEVIWTGSDFAVMGVMLFGAAGLFDLAAGSTRSLCYRAGAALAILAGFMLVWANLAVGMIGSEGNPYNLLFAGAIAAAVAGAVAARFEAKGMSWAMLAAAAVQIAVAAFGFPADPLGSLFSGLLAGLWLAAAGMFRRAARGR